MCDYRTKTNHANSEYSDDDAGHKNPCCTEYFHPRCPQKEGKVATKNASYDSGWGCKCDDIPNHRLLNDNLIGGTGDDGHGRYADSDKDRNMEWIFSQKEKNKKDFTDTNRDDRGDDAADKADWND